jgi:hypothetical protein
MLAENRFCNGKWSGDAFISGGQSQWSGRHQKRDLLVAVFLFCEAAGNL